MGLAGHFRSSDIVLLYHRIGRVSPDPWCLCVTPEHFSEHLEVLRRFHPIRLRDIRPASPRIGRKLSVAITFDDGYADNLYEAARLLKRYDMPATFFLTTGFIGSTREFWWDELERAVLEPVKTSGRFQATAGEVTVEFDGGSDGRATFFSLYKQLQPLSHEIRRQIMDQLLAWSDRSAGARRSHVCLTHEEVRRLAADDLFEIGSHTVTHPVLSARPLESQYMELRASKTMLEDLVERRVASCSYPYGGTGHYSPDTMKTVAEIGYARACTTSAHAVSRCDLPYAIPRFNITDMDGANFERLLLQARWK